MPFRQSQHSKTNNSADHTNGAAQPSSQDFSSLHPLLQLQQTIGNRAVGRVIQAKLKVNEPGDRFEQEADRVADQVMRMPEPVMQRQEDEGERIQTKPLASQISPLTQRQPISLQRKCEACTSRGETCPTCAEDERLQRKPLASRPTTSLQRQNGARHAELLQSKTTFSHAPMVSAGVSANINAMRGGGQPLSPSLRAFFEPRFGTNFSNIRIHTGDKAAELARGLNARAFTVGKNIFFGAGQHASNNSESQRLLAHELTHTIQQGGEPLLPSQIVQRVPAEPEDDACASEPSDKKIKKIVVDQETPQQVTVHWNDNSQDSDECSTGKGHCCVGQEAAEGAVCSVAGSKQEGSNCTPIGTKRVAFKRRRSPGGVEFWTQFDSRGIALHKYSRVDGTPLSHGCVRLDESMARMIYCGSVPGRTEVQVKGFARPRCDHEALQKEWVGDFQEAGSDPPDGETIDPATRSRAARIIANTRRMLRSAMGISDQELTSIIEQLERETDHFALGTSSQRTQTLGQVASHIPRCVPHRTREEARLTQRTDPSQPSEPEQILANSGYNRLVRDFERALSRTGSLGRARRMVRRYGRRLWQCATSDAQSSQGQNVDDRPLYWTRLTMAVAIRQWQPQFFRRRNPDRVRRERTDLLERFERASRGMDTASFGKRSRRQGEKKILISGFDPFGLESTGQLGRSNPSGAAVLALDGRKVTSSDGTTTGEIQGVIFPVRFPDFNEGIVERFFRPFLTGSNQPDMIMTISMGGGGHFEVERFAGRRRRVAVPGNLGLSGGPGRRGVIDPPDLAPGPEFLETTLPAPAIRIALGRTQELREEREFTETPPGRGRPVRRTTGRPSTGATAVAGSGGSFLSNEIFYRTLLLRSSIESEIPVGHLHTPFLPAPGREGPDEVGHDELRNAIALMVEEIIKFTLPRLDGDEEPEQVAD